LGISRLPSPVSGRFLLSALPRMLIGSHRGIGQSIVHVRCASVAALAHIGGNASRPDSPGPAGWSGDGHRAVTSSSNAAEASCGARAPDPSSGSRPPGAESRTGRSFGRGRHPLVVGLRPRTLTPARLGESGRRIPFARDLPDESSCRPSRFGASSASEGCLRLASRGGTGRGSRLQVLRDP
jgi:hypothetical protein